MEESFESSFESFGTGNQENEKDFSILNEFRVLENLRSHQWGDPEALFKKKKLLSKARAFVKGSKKPKNNQGKTSEEHPGQKQNSRNLSGIPDLSSLVGKVSLERLTEMNQKLLENQKKEAELHPYVQEYLKNQAFQKYPVNSKEAVVYEHPAHCDPNEKMSLIKIFKDVIGKDVTRITLPCYLNEPGTILSGTFEILTYKSLLDRACKEEDQYHRLGLTIGAFFMNFSHSIGRKKKPINPLLGETFEIIWEDLQGIGEQVSHHPPISAKFLKTKGYTLLCKESIYKIKKNSGKLSPKCLSNLVKFYFFI